jgi:hypothetical protein
LVNGQNHRSNKLRNSKDDKRRIAGPFLEPDPFGTAWLTQFYDHKTFFYVTASDIGQDFRAAASES